MKKIITSFIFLVLIFSFNCPAQTALEKTVFWKISGNGLKDTSYLYGTTHLIFKNDLYIPDTVIKALSGTAAVYFERLSSPHYDSLVKQIYTMSKPRLPRLMGKIGYKKLVEVLTELNHPVLNDPLFNYIMPDRINAMIGSTVAGNLLTGFDDSLMILALKAGKPLFELDTDEFRKRVADSRSIDNQADALYRLIKDMDQSARQRVQAIKRNAITYYTGDIEVMYTKSAYVEAHAFTGHTRLLGNPLSTFLLDKRNKDWQPIIQKAIEAASVFFAFGAAHLAGPNGIIALLRKKGYTVSPVLLKFK
jgi:uncharacterized protein